MFQYVDIEWREGGDVTDSKKVTHLRQ